jgi:hypothetical protein
MEKWFMAQDFEDSKIALPSRIYPNYTTTFRWQTCGGQPLPKTFPMKKSFSSLFLFCMLLLLGPSLQAQYQGKKNGIKFNLTNPVIFGGNSFILGYERTIGKRQSLGIAIGTYGLPKFGKGPNNDSIQVTRNMGQTGVHFSAEYRFYLGSENKFEAPRGVYIGPYYSFNQFKRGNTWRFNTQAIQGNVETEFALKAHTIGLELGYQFILWKRVSLDFVLLGPGIGIYDLNLKIKSNATVNQQSEMFQRFNNFLNEKIPGYALVINEGEFKRTGAASLTSIGLRYQVNVGFRF